MAQREVDTGSVGDGTIARNRRDDPTGKRIPRGERLEHSCGPERVTDHCLERKHGQLPIAEHATQGLGLGRVVEWRRGAVGAHQVDSAGTDARIVGEVVPRDNPDASTVLGLVGEPGN